MDWTDAGRLARAVQIERAGGTDDAEYYVYGGGESLRQRKVTQRVTDVVNGTTEEVETRTFRGVLGTCELRVITRGGVEKLSRWSSHLSAGDSRIATLHRWTKDVDGLEVDDITDTRLLYPLSDHLGSVAIELNDSAELVSLEEHFADGGTAFVLGDAAREVNLREYRYSGKLRDSFTGFYAYDYRELIPWLGNWLSPDPAGDVDGPNRFAFVGGNPVRFVDERGLSGIDATEQNYSEYPESAPSDATMSSADGGVAIDYDFTAIPIVIEGRVADGGFSSLDEIESLDLGGDAGTAQQLSGYEDLVSSELGVATRVSEDLLWSDPQGPETTVRTGESLPTPDEREADVPPEVVIHDDPPLIDEQEPDDTGGGGQEEPRERPSVLEDGGKIVGGALIVGGLAALTAGATALAATGLKIAEGTVVGTLTLGADALRGIAKGVKAVGERVPIPSVQEGSREISEAVRGTSEQIDGLRDQLSDSIEQFREELDPQSGLGENRGATAEPERRPDEIPANQSDDNLPRQNDAESIEGGTLGEPGRWKSVNESMSQRAADYQARFGRPGEAYSIDDVDFDGFRDGRLIEAKGPGYETFLKEDGTFKDWFEGRDSIANQLINQDRVSGRTPVELHVAEERVAGAIRRIAIDLNVNISIIHTP